MTAAARQVFRLPDLGEGLTEAEIVEWKVAAGDTVEVDQVVVEVETAKAAVEVPVPYAGTVLRLHAEAGAVLAVGEPLIEVGPADAPDAHPDAARYREEEQAGSGNVLIGYGTGHGQGRRGRRRAGGPKAPAATPAPVAPAPAAPAPVAPAPAAPAPAPRRADAPRVISPLVRRIAREHGLDLGAVAPTGPRGVILRRDVEQAIAAAGTAAETAAEAPAPAARPMPERIPLRGLRRAVADKLTRSRAEIPDATTWVDADATALVEAKDALRRSRPELGVGLLALLARICVAALREFPELNSSVDTGRQEIVRYGHVNLGFAAQTDRGLVVPVVRDAHLMTTAQIAAELAGLTGLARSGSLPPEALTGGTFTLNNYGVFGVDGSTPIINHPEAALLGVGRIIDRPWVVDGAVVPRKMTQLSLTFDHRVCDGGAAGGFLRFVADCVENPAVLLTNL
ncbi:pyruvate dehydrogenase E2 component (dihydrolipoamide acetyltransferase) [Actinomadura coerulea]|uniref:Dihydrolipoamide acetyltransferase component of pyruvate dehydrogenase complex n=1 Tax=Actinomadura coerulea TaxID=46159 RepID=A0A7X0G0D3_9ACTN|nr:pyruvate dehydrogenase E2 component (dihydrolipoamide acetyltransferase) [Actinomadura coerulea]GGQ41845.1 dihydrolipoamide acetyltransferase component of pyruvate dehydrogenase complex [Actinomadura coerulea]